MSYILDALKKAEADRDPDARASLAMAQHDRRRNRLLAYGLVIALIANAALLLWLFLPDSEVELDVPAIKPAENTRPEAAAPAAQPVIPSPPATSPAEQPTEVPVSPPRPAAPAASEVAPVEPATTLSAAPAANPDPIPFSSLSATQRQRFPRLEFSTHIYADDSDLRAVVVNGVRLQEGDRLENVQLHEITEEGAVFSWENRLVSVSVLDGWN